MIDFHTHILPEIDDGSKSVEESLKLLNALEAQGVTKVVFTPHYFGIKKSISQFLEQREEAFQKIKECYHGNISFIKGCEFNLAKCMNSDFSELKPIAIEGTVYILTELSFDVKWRPYIFSRINELLDVGLTPVVAHVELYPAVMRNPELVHRLISMGCLIQVNCDSFLNKRTLPLVKALISHSQAHCLGSDTHNLTLRPPRYQAAYEIITKEFGQSAARSLQENMQKILANETVDTKLSEPIKRNIFGKLL